MEEFSEAGNKLKKFCRDHAKGAFIIGLTLALGLLNTRDDLSVLETFLPPAAIWAITGSPYGFLAGYLAFDILGDFWEPTTVPEFLILLGTASLVVLNCTAARILGLSWRGIIRRWLNSLPTDDNDTIVLTTIHQVSGKLLLIASYGLFATLLFGTCLLRSEHQISSECRDAEEAVYQHTGVEPDPWWIPKTLTLATQEEMEELKELAAQFVEKDPEAGRLLEAWETACRDEIAEKTSKSSSGR